MTENDFTALDAQTDVGRLAQILPNENDMREFEAEYSAWLAEIETNDRKQNE